MICAFFLAAFLAGPVLMNHSDAQEPRRPQVALKKGAPHGYSFQVLARLGDMVPGGGAFTVDFEPSGINNRGDVAFGADLTTGGEGIFLRTRTGELAVLARPGDPAPGGGTLGSVFFLRIPINDVGDVALHYFLDPSTLPSGVNSGMYRYSHVTKTVSAVIVPGVTPAPGGGVFAGATISSSLNNRGDIAFTGIVTGADIDPETPPWLRRPGQ